jgi:hypothetical protein
MTTREPGMAAKTRVCPSGKEIAALSQKRQRLPDHQPGPKENQCQSRHAEQIEGTDKGIKDTKLVNQHAHDQLSIHNQNNRGAGPHARDRGAYLTDFIHRYCVPPNTQVRLTTFRPPPAWW